MKKRIFLGLIAGIISGLFASGGGMILVPVLCRTKELDEKKAFATSLGIILPLSVISLCVYLARGGFEFSKSVPYLLGGTIGGLLGGRIFRKVSGRALRFALSLFIIYGGTRLLFCI